MLAVKMAMLFVAPATHNPMLFSPLLSSSGVRKCRSTLTFRRTQFPHRHPSIPYPGTDQLLLVTANTTFNNVRSAVRNLETFALLNFRTKTWKVFIVAN